MEKQRIMNIKEAKYEHCPRCVIYRIWDDRYRRWLRPDLVARDKGELQTMFTKELGYRPDFKNDFLIHAYLHFYPYEWKWKYSSYRAETDAQKLSEEKRTNIERLKIIIEGKYRFLDGTKITGNMLPSDQLRKEARRAARLAGYGSDYPNTLLQTKERFLEFMEEARKKMVSAGIAKAGQSSEEVFGRQTSESHPGCNIYRIWDNRKERWICPDIAARSRKKVAELLVQRLGDDYEGNIEQDYTIRGYIKFFPHEWSWKFRGPQAGADARQLDIEEQKTLIHLMTMIQNSFRHEDARPIMGAELVTDQQREKASKLAKELGLGKYWINNNLLPTREAFRTFIEDAKRKLQR